MHPGLVARSARCSPMHPGLVARYARCSPMHPGWRREKKANGFAVCRDRVSFFFTMTGPVSFCCSLWVAGSSPRWYNSPYAEE
jgi:hypothetical protein